MRLQKKGPLFVFLCAMRQKDKKEGEGSSFWLAYAPKAARVGWPFLVCAFFVPQAHRPTNSMRMRPFSASCFPFPCMRSLYPFSAQDTFAMRLLYPFCAQDTFAAFFCFLSEECFLCAFCFLKEAKRRILLYPSSAHTALTLSGEGSSFWLAYAPKKGRVVFPSLFPFPLYAQNVSLLRELSFVCGSLFLSGEGIQAPHTPRGAFSAQDTCLSQETCFLSAECFLCA